MSPCSEFAVTLAASRPEDAFIDLTANSFLGEIMLSIVVKITFWILSSTVSMISLCLYPILYQSYQSDIFPVFEHIHWLWECYHY